ncbi:TlpA family protein disulfide reductase [Chryseobacterium sp. A321]
MKQYLLVFAMALFAVSCSKKVEIKGKLTGGSPLERVEIIETSSVSTLPLLNMGLDAKGEFSGSFEAEKNGLYVITYGGASNVVYLKKGQTLEIEGVGLSFPTNYVIKGDAKPNNDFLKDAQTGFETYALKINMEELIKKDEAAFLKDFKSIEDSVYSIFEASAKKHKADSDVLDFKKQEAKARLLGVLDGYAQMHGQATQKADFKTGAEFKKVKDQMLSNSDQMIRDYPMFREYQLNQLNGDFQKYRASLPAKAPGEELVSETFANYLETRKDLSATAKDYFFSYVLTQGDLNFMNSKNYDRITALIDKTVSDSKIKTDLKKLQVVLMGHKEGQAPELKLMDKEGKSVVLSDLKTKPSFVVFYASWNPGIAVSTVPAIKAVTDTYGDKVNYVFVNLDDTKDQFQKTSTALFKDFPGTQYWVEGGINAKAAKDFGLYGFKIPSYVLLDKDGKLFARPFFSLQDPQFGESMEKLSGVKQPAPEVATAPSAEPVSGEEAAK